MVHKAAREGDGRPGAASDAGRLRRTGPVLALAVAVGLAWGCGTITQRVIHHVRIDTDGLARAVAVQDFYAYLADGDRGLKIINISNPSALKQVGALDLPGFNTGVATSGDIALVTDSTQKCVYLINVSDKFHPVLKWTIPTLDKVVAVALDKGTAFLAERGDNPSDPAYFSGLEAVACSLTTAPAQLGQMTIKDVRDVAFNSGQVFVLGAQSLTVLTRSASGFKSPALGKLAFSSAEDLQSLDSRAGTHILVLGQALYLVDVTKPSQPAVADQTAVPGSMSRRVVSSTGLLTTAASGNPPPAEFVRFAYSTLQEYGFGVVELKSNKIILVLPAVNVDQLSEGHLKLYDIDMRLDFNKLFAGGDVIAVGALDNYGLGAAY
jgi:hypothetical protein